MRPLLQRLSPIASMLGVLALVGCTADMYSHQADRVVGEILDQGTESTLGGRREAIERPKEVPAEVAPPAVAPGDVAGVQVLSLADALEIAIQSNREYVTAKEALYLQALSLAGTRRTFSPLVAATLTYLFAGGSTTPETHTSGLDMSVSKLLPTGGVVVATGSTGFSTLGSDSFSSSAGIRLTQPLLRGAGREVAYEPLTQAERNLIYAIRDYELFRERFSITVASAFYNLVKQKQAVDNQRHSLDGFVFGRKQAEALFSVGRTSELEVLRARRSELTSQNTLIEAEQNYHLAVDRFRIFLGLPDDRPIEVAPEEPTFVPVNWDIESAVRVAKKNRLDFLNRLEQLDDARRGVRIAKNGLLPDLSLGLGYSRLGRADSSFLQQDLPDDSYNASLTLDVPIDQRPQRDAYRSAQISLARAERSFSEFQDDLEVDVQSTFRELARGKQSLDIQTQLISDQERNVKIAQLRFEQGNFSNRDVVEAQQSLLDAKNALIEEKVAYEIARLGLLKDLGVLFIDEKGMWTE
ncbi:MAG TPA: TolC family protein [Planctomycetota bacterium]|jgi:outer membrane protein TolC|nr:TolC family protein [Planctomycetota bacterium]